MNKVHLVSEHLFAGRNLLVRNFYVRDLRSGKTRSLTQFEIAEFPLQHGSSPLVVRNLLHCRRYAYLGNTYIALQ